MRTYRPHRFVPALYGLLLLGAGGVFAWLAHELDAPVLYVVGASGAALGGSMIGVPWLRERTIRLGADELWIGRRRYALRDVELGHIRSREIRGVEVLDFALRVREADGSVREVLVNANTYWPFEPMHEALEAALEPYLDER